MEIKVLNEDANTLSFLVKDISVPLANALRRTMIAEVPTMIIDDVVIIENTSAMYDEVLTHRLGLIPLVTDLDTYVLPEECTCQSELGCGKCRVTLTLEAEAKEELKNVYSGDLTPDASNPMIHPISDKILVTKLAPGQRIRLEAYARLGTGQVHAKWQPVSVCAYKFMPRIQISRKKCDLCGKCVEACPKKVFSLEGNELKVVNLLECNLCRDCEKACPKDAIGISYDKSSFIFQLESVGGLPNRRVVTEATKILEVKAETFISSLKTAAGGEYEAEKEEPGAG